MAREMSAQEESDLVRTPKRRGPKPGTRHRGQFRPGPDPRRPVAGVAGVVRKALEVRARESTDEAIALIESVMRDETEPTRLRVACASELLDRGHGRTMSREQVLLRAEGGAGGEPAQKLSDEQLLHILSEAHRRATEYVVEGSVITQAETNALERAQDGQNAPSQASQAVDSDGAS